MADLAEELHRLGGGGTRGSLLSAARYWPPAACGLSLPGTLTGSSLAALVLLVGALVAGLTAYADHALQREEPT